MPRIPKKQPTSRLSMELAQPLKDRLEQLRAETGADTLTEVVRRAISLYDHVIQAKASGGCLVIRSEEGEQRIEFF